MVSTSTSIFFARGVIAVALISASTCSLAETYYFSSPSEFDSGGFVTGAFQGEDLNHDGMIKFWHGEVTSFTLSYSGGAIVPAFDYGIQDLIALNYEVGTPFLGDASGYQEALSAQRQLFGPPGYRFDTGYLPSLNGGAGIFSPTGALVAMSLQPLAVTPVPEPSTALMSIIGLFALYLRRRFAH